MSDQIKAEHVPGKADHFQLNAAGQAAVKTARAGFAGEVYDWRAKRSGASITVIGRTFGGEPAQVTEVAIIEPSETSGAGAVATRRNGNRYWLRDRAANLATPA